MKNYDPHQMAKAILWEEAKGKLRAMVACDGALLDHEYVDGDKFKYQVVLELIEDFVKDIEDKEYHL